MSRILLLLLIVVPTIATAGVVRADEKPIKAFPDETIGIIKSAAGGSSILAWKPDWSKEDADRIGQGGRGALYKKMMEKVKQAQSARDIEIVGFVWQQGGRDMTKVEIAKKSPTRPW